MTAPLDLLAIGETMVLVAPGPGQSLRLDSPVALAAGGAESNVAIGAAAQGLRVGWYSRVGGAPLGEIVVDSVRRHGVDTSHVRIDPTRPTGLMVKEPAPAGSRVFYYRAGSAASTMSPADLVDLPAARIVHVSGICAALSDSCHALLDHVLDGACAGASVSFDVNYRPTLWPSADAAAPVLLSLARRADVVFVGRDEAEALWGTSTAEDVRALLPTVPRLVVKDGAVEAVEFDKNATTRAPAITVNVVEPVGAGDAFAAGWLAAFILGHDAERRLQAGHAGAVVALTTHTDHAAPPAPTAGSRP